MATNVDKVSQNMKNAAKLLARNLRDRAKNDRARNAANKAVRAADALVVGQRPPANIKMQWR